MFATIHRVERMAHLAFLGKDIPRPLLAGRMQWLHSKCTTRVQVSEKTEFKLYSTGRKRRACSVPM